MVGRNLSEIYPRVPHASGRTVLEVDRLRGNGKPSSVSFKLREGEIFGLAGLIGAGRTETVRALFGLDRIRGGVVTVRGEASTHADPAGRLAGGMGLLSENRKEEGLMLNRSVADNLTLTRFGGLTRWGWVIGDRQRRAAREWMDRLEVKARGPSQSVGELSGGNQQKVALGRLLHHGATLFLLDEPTRGIDVASKALIYREIGRLAAEGRSVLFISSYLPELLGICDTIGVMCRGILTAARPAAEWTEHSIISAAIGRHEAEGDPS
jgi:ribose transport system ATP-binding protein